MEIDSIRKIAQTEREAEEIKQSAKQQAERIIQNAIESKSIKETKAKKQVEDKRRQLEENAKAENADKIKKIAEDTESECRHIEQKANEKIQTAVNAIFKEVIS